MKRSLKELLGYTIQAIDGEKGRVEDFLFDDETWIIRYLEADLGKALVGKRVLIPRKNLDEPRWEDKHFPVKLTVEKIENSPDLDFDMPVSRAYEKELVKHYDLVPYWPTTMSTYDGLESLYYPQYYLRIPKEEADEDKFDEDKIQTHLRSFREIKGYYINAKDDIFGHIEDVIIDDEVWQIIYIIVNTKNFVPWGKKVLLPIEAVDRISYQKQEATINLPKETIKEAPEYDPSMAVNSEFERVLYDFYGRKIIK